MLALEKVLLWASRYYQPIVRGQEEFTTPGTYSFYVPVGVTKISAVAVGAGGGGAGGINDGGGAGGGALCYLNNISVTPGEALTVIVGNGGSPGAIGTNGGHSAIYRGVTEILRANGGTGGSYFRGGAGGQATIVSTGLSIGTISVSSTNYNQTTNPADSYILVNGVRVNYSMSRGHTVAVFNQNTLVLESIQTYDTYGYGSSGLYSALLNIPDYKIVVIASFDATNFDSTVRYYANLIFKTTNLGTWGSSRVSHIIIGQKNGHILPYESISGTNILVTNKIIFGSISVLGGAGGPGGNGSEFYGGNYLCGGGGGAGGYTGNGGPGGDGQNIAGVSSTSGGGGGGNADNIQSLGGGGVGLRGIGNNGGGNGGGGSSYNSITSTISASLNSPVNFYPVTLSHSWSNFMNTYAVWYDNGSYYRGFYAPISGFYTVECQADNFLDFFIDGVKVVTTSDFTTSTISRIFINAGSRLLRFDVANYGGPAGWALTIRDSYGVIVWDTRTYNLANSVNTAVKVLAGGTNATDVNGGRFGGGGGGGDDSEGGYGGHGGVRIIWGAGRSFPYKAEDVVPIQIATTLNLILYYDAGNPLSYTGGAVINDISGNGNHGTITLGFTPSTPPTLGTNRVIRFPVSQNTKIDFSANELTSSVITVEMWALVDDFAGGMFFGWNVHDVWTTGGTLGFNTGQGDVYGVSAARIDQLNIRDAWAHYVFVMNTGDYTKNRIYINGVSETLGQQYSSQYASNTNFNNGNGRIGGWRLDNSYQQSMDLGIFKIYNRGLSQSEISTLYNENLSRFTTPIYFPGLWGRRAEGYFNDDVNYFSYNNAVELRSFTSLLNITSGRDLYTWEFRGYFRAPASGTYTFYTTSDDASYLWIGSVAQKGFTTSNALVNNGGLHGYASASGTINLVGGSYYPIRIMFGENYGGDLLTVTIYGPFGGAGYTYGDGYIFHDINDKI